MVPNVTKDKTMKTKMKIFNIILLSLLYVMPVAAQADEDCVMYNPAFALCTVHSHNSGFVDADNIPTNPVNAEDIAEMNDIIALKSTVIVQQMKQQYDTLNAMIKRFKTQLEKAVLTSKLEAYTGNSSSSSNSGWSSGGGSGGGSSAQNNGLANAENCDSYTGVNVYDCLVRNLSKVSAALDNDTQNARKQLENDIGIADDLKMCGDNNTKCTEEIKDCDDVEYAYKDTLKKCVTSLSRQINQSRTLYEREEARARSGWRNY